MEADVLGALLAVSASVLLALRAILFRRATVIGDPLAAAMAALWVGVLVFLPVTLFFNYPNFNLTVKSTLIFMVSGLLGSFLGLVSYCTGIKRVGASKTESISMGRLLVATFFGIVFLGEVITSGHLLGTLLLTGGVLIVSSKIGINDENPTPESFSDLLFPLGAMFFFGSMSVVVKFGFSEGVPIATGLTIMFMTASLALGGFLFLRRDSPFYPFRANERKFYLAAGLVQTIALGLYFSSLQISRVVVAVPFRGMTPLFVLLLSYAFLRSLEGITKVVIFGTILVVIGAILIGIFM